MIHALRLCFAVLLSLLLALQPAIAARAMQSDAGLSVRNIADSAFDNALSTGINSLAYGTDFVDGYTTSMAASLVNLAMADVQNEIGDIGVTERNPDGSVKTTNPNWEGSPGHILLHGLTGCAAAELQGADCAAGAAAGAAQAMYIMVTQLAGINWIRVERMH